MRIVESYSGGAAVAHLLRTHSQFRRPWQLRWKPVCASTENDLSDWLMEKPFNAELPRALIAARQTHGIGQRGRTWHAPLGGVWISAAIPLFGQKSAGLLGLAVAVAMAQRLERSSVSVQIKWPNDLMVGNRKLAGFLPRIVYRGETLRFGRIGLGLNVRNNIPMGGTSLAEILRPINCRPFVWASEVLIVLDRVAEMIADADSLTIEAEGLLWAKEVKDPKTGEIFEIEGLTKDGALKLRQGSYKTVWNRWG